MRTSKLLVDTTEAYRAFCDYLNMVENQETDFLDEMFLSILYLSFKDDSIERKIKVFNTLSELINIDSVINLVNCIRSSIYDAAKSIIGDDDVIIVSLNPNSPTILIVEVFQ